MKSKEELQSLFQELAQAYKTVLNPETPYDPVTIAYAKRCMDDAQKAYLLAKITEEQENGNI